METTITRASARCPRATHQGDNRTVKLWQCMTCGYIYNEAEGEPEDGIAPETAWEDVPEDWICPECGTPKSDFEMVEVG